MRKLRACFVVGSFFVLTNCGSDQGSQFGAVRQEFVPLLDYQSFDQANKDGGFSALENFDDYMNGYNQKNSTAVSTLVFSGGWNSCNPDAKRTDVYRRAVKLLESRASIGLFYNVVATCYKVNPDKIYVYSSKTSGKVASSGRNELYRELKAITRNSASQSISLVGHSYGGWLAMKAAINLSSQVTVDGLATLDPISQEDCSIKKAISSPYRLFVAIYKGCVRAPDDINYGLIALQVKWWDQFYQSNSRLLHSSNISEAHSNHHLDYSYNRVLKPFTAHMEADSDDRAWNVFSDKL